MDLTTVEESMIKTETLLTGGLLTQIIHTTKKQLASLISIIITLHNLNPRFEI